MLDKSNLSYQPQCRFVRKTDWDEYLNADEKWLSCDGRPGGKLVVMQTLAAFGDLLDEIILFGGDLYELQGKFLEKLNQHCGGTLNSLKLENFNWTQELNAQALPLLSQLKNITLRSFQNVTAILPAIENCVAVEIYADGTERNIFDSKFSRLEKLRFGLWPMEDGSRFGEFLSRHLHMKSLDLAVPDNTDLTAIGQLHALETLVIEGNWSIDWMAVDHAAFKFNNLKRLTCLSDTEDNNEVSLLLHRLSDSAATKTLQYVHIQHTQLSSLANFKNLEELKLYSGHNVRLPLIQSLKILRLSDITVDRAFILDLGQLPQLEELDLRGMSFHEDITDADKLLLQNVNQLKKLFIMYMESNQEWLKYLGSTKTLRSLTIWQSETFIGIGRYRNLSELIFRTMADYIDDSILDACSELRHLKSLQRLEILDQVFGTYACDIYSHLGSTKSLQELVLIGVVELTASRLRALDVFTHLRTLEIGQAIFYWPSITELIARLPSLTKLILRRHKDIDFNEQVFGGFLELCKKQNRKIIIELHTPDVMDDVPRLFYENDNCRYVEVRPYRYYFEFAWDFL